MVGKRGKRRREGEREEEGRGRKGRRVEKARKGHPRHSSLLRPRFLPSFFFLSLNFHLLVPSCSILLQGFVSLAVLDVALFFAS